MTPRKGHIKTGITRKTALLTWLLTLLTLLTFVVAIIPEQKQAFLDSMKSKGRSVAVSLQDITATGVVNEDYSGVVDHCLQLVRGDPSILYLVVSRKDGFSLLVTPDGWRNETLGKEWRPDSRQPQATLGLVPKFQKRAFQYSSSFDYSGIEWGWIHVGLSPRSYEESVRSVYLRTGLLAVFCAMASLLVSILYARRLMHPIRLLEAVLQKVAAGDLSVRAHVRSGDEIESLAASVNSMTESLLHRDRVLDSVRFAAQQFLSTSEWTEVIHSVLERIGRAALCTRVFVAENGNEDGRELVSKAAWQWRSSQDAGDPQPSEDVVCWTEPGLANLAERLDRGELCSGMGGRGWMSRAKSPCAYIFVPIITDRSWWGILALEESRYERRWTEAERQSLHAVAGMLSAAIMRHRAQHALLESRDLLEHRVEMRTRELREQVHAKEAALAKLAEAQNVLMDLSRKSGMAEVATGVLHNVGNVLNSVNISAGLISERLSSSQAGGLAKLCAMLESHKHDLGAFLVEDPKGRKVLDYLSKLAAYLEEDRQKLLGESYSLVKNVEHIKEIVAMQQSYARVAGVTEDLHVSTLIEDALRLNTSAFQREGIEVRKELTPVPLVRVDKHKVLQILLNLLRNARQALHETEPGRKVVTLSVARNGNNRIKLCVADNGVGIARENLTKIFQHGFTTKRDGHGFGLHSGANAAREMGGSLVASSDGPGLGAKFILELPIATVDGAHSL